MQVYLHHARKLKYCSSGIRQFCQIYDIKFVDFVRNGIDSEVLAKTNDDLAIDMIKLAEEEAKNGQ